MKTVRKISLLILGFVFFIAGVLKLMDPVGAGLVVEEYLKFLHLGFLAFWAKPVAVGLALLESVLGAMMLTGVWKKISALLSAPLIAGFTILTAILWILNPPMDCGCFGEAIHLTHAQSFLKNVVLCGLWAAAYLPFSSLTTEKPIKKVSFAIASLSLVAFMVYSLLNIPLVDFTPYEVGTELVKTEDPELDAPTRMLVYERDGKEGAFFENILPDSTWKFVREEVYVRNLPLYTDGEQPLSFCDSEGNYCDSLATSGTVAIVSVHSPEKLSERDRKRIALFIGAANSDGFPVIELEAAEARPGVYSADRRTLLTLNRSNGGVTVVIDGQIVGKWSCRHIMAPDLNTLAERDSSESALEQASSGRLKLQGFLLYSVAVMLLL